jgi:hypothetical protein
MTTLPHKYTANNHQQTLAILNFLNSSEGKNVPPANNSAKTTPNTASLYKKSDTECISAGHIIPHLCVKGIIPVKVLCFDTLLQVLILKGVSSCWLRANPWGGWRPIPTSKDNAKTCLRRAGAENAQERREGRKAGLPVPLGPNVQKDARPLERRVDMEVSRSEGFGL